MGLMGHDLRQAELLDKLVMLKAKRMHRIQDSEDGHFGGQRKFGGWPVLVPRLFLLFAAEHERPFMIVLAEGQRREPAMTSFVS